jgi:hypothetical protein
MGGRSQAAPLGRRGLPGPQKGRAGPGGSGLQCPAGQPMQLLRRRKRRVLPPVCRGSKSVCVMKTSQALDRPLRAELFHPMSSCQSHAWRRPLGGLDRETLRPFGSSRSALSSEGLSRMRCANFAIR